MKVIKKLVSVLMASVLTLSVMACSGTDKNKTALIAEKTAEYAEGQSSALAAAKRGYIDDIIEPDATRKRLIAAYEMLYGKKVTPVTKKHTAV